MKTVKFLSLLFVSILILSSCEEDDLQVVELKDQPSFTTTVSTENSSIYYFENTTPNKEQFYSFFEIEGKKSAHGLTVAFGPELWWGANPAVLVKYSRSYAGFDFTGIFHEDLDEQAPAVSSFAVPSPPTRRATLHIARNLSGLGVEIGGIWAGQPRVGETFQIVDGEEGNYKVYQDEITSDDTWGGKVKLTYSFGPINWYAQGAAMGLVAGGGADYTKTFTGWKLKDSGSGNQYNILSGFTYGIGDFQFAPNKYYKHE